MKEVIQERAFREPDGLRYGAVYAIVGLVFFAMFLTAPDDLIAFSVIGAIFVLMAVPEILPRNRTRAAGMFRILTLVLALIAIPLTLLALL